ncbi:CLUMA_CG009114, isoform A [Clunio marinus]|uniref:CLUMA_CG009114, isoform A n=1 Tax=Clunio marinus TaxID=568069 RepID=A0A1J1I5V8_9DIPT|nr:CLUMA_CG009114, isoform A [Clunio marinus]
MENVTDAQNAYKLWRLEKDGREFRVIHEEQNDAHKAHESPVAKYTNCKFWENYLSLHFDIFKPNCHLYLKNEIKTTIFEVENVKLNNKIIQDEV